MSEITTARRENLTWVYDFKEDAFLARFVSILFFLSCVRDGYGCYSKLRVFMNTWKNEDVH